jgi:hypothetical protein
MCIQSPYNFASFSFLTSDYGIRLAEMMRSNTELSRHAQITEQDNLLMKVRRIFVVMKFVWCSFATAL